MRKIVDCHKIKKSTNEDENFSLQNR